jgi:hypothetical protein
MPDKDAYCFVLWAERFDEVAAAIFVSELRKAGLRVKLVGMAGNVMAGVGGLKVVADMTLEQALHLADKSACVVIPGKSPGVGRLLDDPRLLDFLDRARRQQAMFVVNQSCTALAAGAGSIVAYAGDQPVLDLAHEIAGRLGATPVKAYLEPTRAIVA